MLLVLLLFITFSFFMVFSYKIKIANIMAMYFLGCLIIMFAGIQYFTSLSSHQYAGTIDNYILTWLMHFKMSFDNVAVLHNIGIIVLMSTSLWCANLARPMKWWVNALAVIPMLFIFCVQSPSFRWSAFLKIASGGAESNLALWVELWQICSMVIFFMYMLLPLVFFGIYISNTKIFLKKKYGIACLVCIVAMDIMMYLLFVDGIFTPTMFYNIDLVGFPTSFLGIYSENIAIIISVFCMIFINYFIILYFKPFEKYGRWRKRNFIKRSRAVSENLHMQLHMYKNTFLCIEKFIHIAENAVAANDKEEVKGALRRIKTEAGTSVEDISRTLKMLNNVVMDYHVFTIESCIREAISRAVTSDTEAECKFEDRNTVVLGNKAHIVESLVNILRNSVEAMQNNPAGKRKIEIDIYAEEDMILVNIKDNGCGISKKNLKRVFKLFFTTKAQKIGTGLGLDYAKRVISIHGGDILVKSVEGSGTNVYVALPVYRHR